MEKKIEVEELLGEENREKLFEDAEGHLRSWAMIFRECKAFLKKDEGGLDRMEEKVEEEDEEDPWITSFSS